MTSSSVTDEHQAVPVPRATLEALELDAGRYRWLQANGECGRAGWHSADMEQCYLDLNPRDMDAAIDAAIDSERLATGFNAALECTKDAVGRDGRGEPDTDEYEEMLIRERGKS